MTIQFQGNVDSIENGPIGKENITFRGASEWVEHGNKAPLGWQTNQLFTIAVPKDIAKSYRPGDPIQVTIVPLKPRESN